MKINHLILKNFSAIKNAMNANEIKIDFTKEQNKICLLIGPNGSGKTTILSMLHPFSDVGNLDTRNGYNLILDGKDGYKEIEIQNKNDIFLIKHFYTHKKDGGHSVKSYIFKNGEDLNVNGNVTSFKEIVKDELQIEPDYLKLIRLGSNVTSMIDLSATERKNFMSKIMDDIGIYLEYYKSINQKIRDLDQLLSHTIDKINKLNIEDKKEKEKEIKEINKEIERYEQDILNLNGQISTLENKISEYGNIDEFYSNGREITKKYNKMKSILNKKDEIESFDSKYYDDKIDKLEKELNSYKNELSANELLIQNSLSYLNTLESQKRETEIELDKQLNTSNDIKLAKDNLDTIENKIIELKKNIEGFTPTISKHEFESFYNFIVNIQKLLNRTYEFGKKPVEKVINLIKNKKNVMNFINSHLIDIDEKTSDSTPLFISAIEKRCAPLLNDKDPEFGCDKECIAKDVFMQLRSILKDSNIYEKNDDDISFYHDMEFVYGNLNSIFPQFYDYKDTIDKLPDDIKKDFLIDSIYTNVKKLRYIYDDKKMNDYLSQVTEYENYINLKNIYDEQKSKLKTLKSLSNESFIKKQLSTIYDSIDNENDKIKKFKNRNSELNSLIKEDEYSYERFSDIKETIEKFDETKDSYDEFILNRKIIEDSNNEIDDLTKVLNDKKVSLKIQRENYQMQVSNLNQYNDLMKEKSKFSKVYDDMILIKNSLSSKTGIPLRIISNYLDNTNEITNDFLNIVYDGRIYLDTFQITSTEFSIPFYNNGVRLDDVKYASQGELSFLSIALSFALSYQVLRKYNIMLLDEIDGPLDTSNREKFIKILEAQIDKIDAEQSFLITHNSMFSSYPVSILDLSFKNQSDEYPNANFISIERS